MTKCVWLTAKTYSYLIDDSSEDKKAKECIIKRKLKFEDYENSLKTNQLKTKINHLQKNKINMDSLKEFIKTS